ncbi:hypothetical protein TWF281_003241 [Arthrobotrys megalospora]
MMEKQTQETPVETEKEQMKPISLSDYTMDFLHHMEPFSHILSPPPAESGPAGEAKKKDPQTTTTTSRFDQIVTLIESATMTKDEEVDAGRVPTSPVISLKPSGSELDLLQLYLHLEGANAILNLYSSMTEIQLREARGEQGIPPLDGSTNLTQILADRAEATFRAITGPLAGIYTIGSARTQTIDRVVDRSEIDLDFFKQLFEGIDVDEDSFIEWTVTQMKDFVTLIRKYGLGLDSKEPNLLIRINWIKKVKVSEDVVVSVPVTRLSYIKIDTKSWRTALEPSSGKRGNSESSFRFVMTTVIYDAELNVQAYMALKPKATAIMGQVLENGTQNLEKVINDEGIEALGEKMCYVYDCNESKESETEGLDADLKVKA